MISDEELSPLCVCSEMVKISPEYIFTADSPDYVSHLGLTELQAEVFYLAVLLPEQAVKHHTHRPAGVAPGI